MDDLRRRGESRQFACDPVVEPSPKRHQQVWFIEHFGSDVNLGNIRPDDVIPLETLRLGIRSDTFFAMESR